MSALFARAAEFASALASVAACSFSRLVTHWLIVWFGWSVSQLPMLAFALSAAACAVSTSVFNARPARERPTHIFEDSSKRPRRLLRYSRVSGIAGVSSSGVEMKRLVALEYFTFSASAALKTVWSTLWFAMSRTSSTSAAIVSQRPFRAVSALARAASSF